MKLNQLLIAALATLTITSACGSNSTPKAVSSEENSATEPVATTQAVTTEPADEVVCNGDPNKASYIVISKETMTLKLYDVNHKVIFNFPVAVGKNYGDKQRERDMKTPEGEFTIQQIVNSTTWSHDFRDGKGKIQGAYGDWFIRLKTPPHTGIGIHGTHDPNSIGTRATEGCIRLNNKNLNKLQPLVKVGMKVTIETSRLDLEADGRTVSESTTPSTQQDAEVATTTPEPAKTVTEPAKQTPAEPAKVEQKPVASTNNAATGTIVEHVIESGEVLGTIAGKYNTTVKRIEELNPGVEATKIRPGQKIRVEKGAPKQEAPKDPNAVYHVVEKGDFGSTIANKYNTSWEKIMELNPGLNERNLQIGKKVRVK